MELGQESLALHREIVEKAVELNIDGLIIVSDGLEAKEMYKAGSSLSYCSVQTSISNVAQELNSLFNPGDNLLLKASRKVSLERLLPLLKEYY